MRGAVLRLTRHAWNTTQYRRVHVISTTPHVNCYSPQMNGFPTATPNATGILLPVKDLVESHERMMNLENMPIEFHNPELASSGVFTNTELRLSDIDVFGFDYDYTLAPYTTSLDEMIAQKIINSLIDKHHYPVELRNVEYDHSFIKRGVHYDINAGIFLKVDAYHRIQTDSVYEAFTPLTHEEVEKRYPSRTVIFSKPGSNTYDNVRQIIDIFERPQLFVWGAVMDYLKKSGIQFYPRYLFEDIENVTRDLHIDGFIHGAMMSDIGQYLEPNPKLHKMLRQFKEQGKQMFVLTNSPFPFVDCGMRHMIGDDWKDLFHVIVCLSKKPKFFESKHPFRRTSSQKPAFGEVKELLKGEIYSEGNVGELHRLTGWEPHKILYFGDQMLADLAEPVMNQGWHTGAIVPELSEEIKILNTPDYQYKSHILTELNSLISLMQCHLPDVEAVEYVDRWAAQRKEVRHDLKEMVNPHFGSIFRTHLQPTLFYRRLSRFAEIYTSDLTNLKKYDGLNYRFTPVKTALPHELPQ